MPRPKLSLTIPTEDMLAKKSLDSLKEFGLNEQDYEKIKEVNEKLKYFDKEFCEKHCDKHLPITFDKVEDKYRQVVRVKHPVNQLFYKSKGESRDDNGVNTGVWFPFEGYDKTSFYIRMKKSEDKYINSFQKLGYVPLVEDDITILTEMAKNPELSLYGRMLNYTIASISATLTEYNI